MRSGNPDDRRRLGACAVVAPIFMGASCAKSVQKGKISAVGQCWQRHKLVTHRDF